MAIESENMMERDGAKTYLLVFSLYLLLALVYFHEIFTEGLLIAPGDAYMRNYPVREFLAASLKQFQLPLWNPYEYLGIPFMGAMQPGALYPPNIVLYFLLPPEIAYNASLLLHHALAGFFTYLYVRLLGPGRMAAFTAGVVFGFSGFIADHTQHIAMVNTAPWLPLALYLFEKFRRTGDMRYPASAALVLAVQVTAGHFQIFLYSSMTLGAVLLFSALQHGGAKDAPGGANAAPGAPAAPGGAGGARRFALVSAFALGVGVLMASPYIYAVLELSEISWRRNVLSPSFGYTYFSLFHVYLTTLPSLFFPYIFGGGTYGGELFGPPDAAMAFAGTLPLVLAVAVAARECRGAPQIRVWAAVTVAAMLLALGDDTPLGRLMYHVPVYNLFRSHSRNLYVFMFAVSVLSAFGLDSIMRGGKRAGGYLKAAAWSSAVIVLLTAVIVSLSGRVDLGPLFEFLGKTGFKEPERLALALSFSNPALLVPFVIICGYLAWSVAALLKPVRALRFAVVGLVILEAFTFGGFQPKGSLKLSNLNAYNSEFTEVVERLGTGEGRHRVFPMSAKSAPLVYLPRKTGFVYSYEPLAPERINRLLNHHTEWIKNNFYYSYEYNLRNNLILSMLNVRYLTVPKGWDVDLSVYEKAVDFSRPEIMKPTAIRPVMVENAGAVRGGYVLSKNDAGRKGSALMSLELKKGAYRLSFKTESLSRERPFLTAFLFEAPYTRGGMAAYVYPADIGGEHYGIFGLNRPGKYLLSFVNEPPGIGAYHREFGPLRVTDIKVERLEGYAPPALGRPSSAGGGPLYRKIFDTASYDVYENTNALPRAYGVSKLSSARDFAAVKRRFDLMEINPAREAVLYEDGLRKLGRTEFSLGEVSITEYGNHRVAINADFPDGEGFLVLADQHYPGWRAFVDGVETEIYETNGVLRGVAVPRGSHEVVFRYLPYGIFALLALGAVLAAVTAGYLIFSSRPLLRGPGR